MASYFLLSNCVVLSVLVGSVLCGGTGDRSPDSGKKMKRNQMLDVTLIEPDGNELECGLLRSILSNDENTWRWEFYDCMSWDMDCRLTKDAKIAASFLTTGVNVTERTGKAVKFTYDRDSKSSQTYRLIFSREKDAELFISQLGRGQ